MGLAGKDAGAPRIRLLHCPSFMHAEPIQLLRRRESIIADHARRDRDAADHLDALKSVSEEIFAWAAAHKDIADARLRHYLANASFAKALDHLETMAGD
jgi:hypothetical protein